MIGIAVQVLRKKKGFTQVDFSKKIGITQPNLSLLEKNKLTPSLSRIKKIASVLKVPVAYLFIMSISDSEISKENINKYKVVFPKIKELTESLI